MHAEFQLNEPPLQPFWFTPAYFSGNLIISRNATSVLYFNLAVPNHNKLNVGELKIYFSTLSTKVIT